ncbi:MAG: methyltransferase, partial [Myxococcales bacterium]|nr:methyltransferase [Myxococcales bacterium]
MARAAATTSSSELAARFAALDAWLGEHTTVWQHRPFVALPAPWEATHPEVAEHLRAADEARVADLEEEVEAAWASTPARLRAWRDEGVALAQLPALAEARVRLDERWARGVPGRKRAQIVAFAAAVRERARPAQWVDWCAGKGHLGRALGVLDGPALTFVERQAPLARAAAERARASGLVASAIVTDVLAAAPSLPESAGLVALHACGALSDAAILAATRAGSPQIAIAPCCFHYHPGADALPLRSTLGRRSSLAARGLTSQALRFATAEEVAAPGRRRRQRSREEAFRLALDQLLRETTGEDRYHHVPPVPRPWLALGFEGWLQRVAALHRLRLPARFDAASL